MVTPWNKGYTKDSHPSVGKIAATMRGRKLDNFKEWRDKMKKEGKMKSSYARLKKNGELVELIGVILGDGHIGVFPRTESLRLVSNSNNEGFIERYSLLVEKVFQKKPYVKKRNNAFATDITIYEKEISKRLGIPSGARGEREIAVPSWIKQNKNYVLAYLRGLYEAEGSYNVHEKTYTHKFIFSNTNQSLLTNVFNTVEGLGFHPHRSKNKIQVSRKEEVQKLKNLLEFRRY